MNQFKPIPPRDAASYERQVQGLQHQLAQYRLQEHAVYICMCGEPHCENGPETITCALQDGTLHCVDAECGWCRDEAARERQAEAAEDLRRHGA